MQPAYNGISFVKLCLCLLNLIFIRTHRLQLQPVFFKGLRQMTLS